MGLLGFLVFLNMLLFVGLFFFSPPKKFHSKHTQGFSEVMQYVFWGGEVNMKDFHFLNFV